MKIALVHDFLNQYGGAERVLDAFLEIWPKADVYTLLYDKNKMGKFYNKFNIKTSFVQKFPAFPPAGYKWWLMLFPKAIEKFNLKNYDLVLSDSSAFAKGVITHKPSLHVCYMHTPTRYLWSVTKEYLHDAPIPNFIRPIMPPFIEILKKWDYKAAQRPQYIIANSENVAKRIKKFYDRDADEIIFPYVDTKRFTIQGGEKKYWLVVGRQEPYKKTDLAIKAANKLGFNLIVAGSGTRIEKFVNIAGKNIKFVGRLPDNQIAKLFENSIGLIFPPEEDAGITPLESMAAGRPVIAYQKGGVKESITPGVTGEFFTKQTPENLAEAIKNFRPEKYDPAIIRNHAKKFDKASFKEKIIKFIENKI